MLTTTTSTHRTAQLVHQRRELRAELRPHTDEGKLSRLLTRGDRVVAARLEDIAYELALALRDEKLERKVKRVVVLLDELVLKHEKGTNITH